MSKESDLTFVFQNPNTDQMTKEALGRWVAKVCLPVMEERIMALVKVDKVSHPAKQEKADNNVMAGQKDPGSERER